MQVGGWVKVGDGGGVEGWRVGRGKVVEEVQRVWRVWMVGKGGGL